VQFLKNIFSTNTNAKEFKKQLNNVIGFTPGDAAIYKTALSHRSVREGADENNERLEFLGDAVLSSIVAHYLFRKYPYKGEGFLTEMRSKMVNRQKLNEIAYMTVRLSQQKGCLSKTNFGITLIIFQQNHVICGKLVHL